MHCVYTVVCMVYMYAFLIALKMDTFPTYCVSTSYMYVWACMYTRRYGQYIYVCTILSVTLDLLHMHQLCMPSILYMYKYPCVFVDIVSVLLSIHVCCPSYMYVHVSAISAFEDSLYHPCAYMWSACVPSECKLYTRAASCYNLLRRCVKLTHPLPVTRKLPITFGC